jgi:hypothetical protein
VWKQCARRSARISFKFAVSSKCIRSTNDIMDERVLIASACRAREVMDEAHTRPLQPGERVRCFATRETVEVVETEEGGAAVTVRSERDGSLRSELRASLAAVGVCHCGLPQQRDGPCMSGHVAAAEALPAGLSLGTYLRCASPREDRVVGLLLASMIGDVLGAAFEGHGSKVWD